MSATDLKAAVTGLRMVLASRPTCLSLLTFLVVLGCGEKGHVRVSDNDLPGTYAADFGKGKEQLILHSDKTYEQVFSSPTRNFANWGKWKTGYVLLEGTDVELMDANCSDQFDPVPVPNCHRNLNVHRERGKLKLAINETADWYFDRVD